MDLLIIAIVITILVIAGVAFYVSRPKIKPKTESLYTDALNAIVRGDNHTAMEHLRNVVKQNTEHVGAYLQLGDLLWEDNHPEQAIKIHQALTVRPNLPDSLKVDIHKSLALDYSRKGEMEKAKIEGERILKIDRKNTWCIEFLLEIAERERDWEQAASMAKLSQRLNHSQDENRLAKFQVYQGMDKLARGDRPGAETSFNKAIQLAPTFGLPYLRKGDFLAEERNLVKAIDAWEQFAILSPEQSRCVFSKIETALFDLGRFSEVEKFYQRVLERDSSNIDALAKLANVYEEKGEHQKALNLVNETLNQNQDSAHVRLMKLKLSLNTSRPHELAHQIDELADLITSQEKNA